MTTSPSPIRLAKEAARAHLAATATWQRLTHTSDAEEAAGHIFLDAPHDPETGEEYQPDELEGIYPYMQISTTGENSFVAEPIGTQAYDFGGVLAVDLFLSLPGKSTREAVEIIETEAGRLMFDVAELGERPGHLARPSIALDGFMQVEPDDEPGLGAFWLAGFTMSWGNLRGE